MCPVRAWSAVAVLDLVLTAVAKLAVEIQGTADPATNILTWYCAQASRYIRWRTHMRIPMILMLQIS